MTLQQLKYAVAVADHGSISEAAKALFIAQPSLSNAVRDLEAEIRTTIFIRTSRGVQVTVEGAEFLGYARQVLQQSALLEAKYLSGQPAKQRFSISTHHYLFAANAFVELIRQFGAEEYEFTFRETKTYEVIDDVRNLRSEIGLIYLSEFNTPVLSKLLRESGLIFTELFSARPHVFLYKFHPLARKTLLSFDDLDPYPCLTFEQGGQNSFYFSEEAFSTRYVKKSIKVSDRAAEVNLMIGVDAYTICTGVFPEYLHGDDIVSIPLDAEERIRVGAIMHQDVTLTRLGETYLDALRRIAERLRGDAGSGVE